MSKSSRKNRSKKTDQVHEESFTIKDGVHELEQEGDGDYVTKEYVCEMMKMQESLFRNLFDSLLTNVNEICPEMHALAKMAEMAINRQTINKNSNEMAKGPFAKWRFWRKWQKWCLIAKIAKL